MQFVVVQALSEDEVADLNAATDAWIAERGAEIDFPGQGQLFFPLVSYPECDITTSHPQVFPLLGEIFGGEEHIRHVEFNWRGWPSSNPDEPGPRGMQFHPDTDGNTADGDVTRFTRRPYGVPNFVSTFYYLTDVDETTPAFCAVPKSRRAATLMDAKEQLGDAYCEVPIRGPAGSCCIIDCTCTLHLFTTSFVQMSDCFCCADATIHTRLDSEHGDGARRIMHHVFARAGTVVSDDGTERPGADPLNVAPPLFSRGLIPKHLAMSEDEKTRRLFSLWPSHQQERVDANFDPDWPSDPKSRRGASPADGYRNPGPGLGHSGKP